MERGRAMDRRRGYTLPELVFSVAAAVG